jgi:high-affinity nickel permease
MALNGIENVRKRLVDQKQQMANFGTYDAAGHHAVHVMRPESLQQKI